MNESVKTPRHNAAAGGWSSGASTGQKIGYARVSKRDQVLDRQIDALEADGCSKVFTDHGATGTTIKRPGLDAALDYMRAGDVLVVQTLDRLLRRTGEMLDFTTELKERGIGFRVLAFPEIDTTGPFGTALLTILGALAQMERDVLAERVQDGLAAARARGRTGGCGFVRLVAGFLQRSVAVLLPRSRRTGCR